MCGRFCVDALGLFCFFGVKINYIFFRKTLFGGVYEEVS